MLKKFSFRGVAQWQHVCLAPMRPSLNTHPAPERPKPRPNRNPFLGSGNGIFLESVHECAGGAVSCLREPCGLSPEVGGLWLALAAHGALPRGRSAEPHGLPADHALSSGNCLVSLKTKCLLLSILLLFVAPEEGNAVLGAVLQTLTGSPTGGQVDHLTVTVNWIKSSCDTK